MGEMKKPADLFKGLHGHILKDPSLPEDIAGTGPAFQGTVGGCLNLECLKVPMCIFENVCQLGEHGIPKK
ncbi:MAG: hypothetical protein AABZ40_03045 [Thermodesulfobacteriota bacterium]